MEMMHALASNLCQMASLYMYLFRYRRYIYRHYVQVHIGIHRVIAIVLQPGMHKLEIYKTHTDVHYDYLRHSVHMVVAMTAK